MSQPNWRWCDKCQDLFFAGNNTLGVCAAGAGHNDSGSGNYDIAMAGSGQSDWRWCNKCQVMFYAGNNTLGVCAAGGAHSDNGSGNYYLSQVPTAGAQPGWRWCKKCEVIFFNGGGSVGVCAAGGGHDDTASGNYSLAKVASFSGPVFSYSSPININGPQDGNIAGPISLNLNQNGAYTFAGQMNNSNHLPNTMAAVILLATASGTVFSFATSGNIDANLPWDNNNWDWNIPGTNALITTAWNDLQAGYIVGGDVSASLNVSALWSVVQTGIQVTGTVIAVVGSVAA